LSTFLIKLIVCPSIVLLSNYLFRSVYYPNLYQPILVGVILAVLGHGMEHLILRRGTFWTSNIMDFGAAFAVLYFGQLLLPGSVVNGFGALLVAFLLNITEYFQHKWLIKHKRVPRL
jgi:hypothetical protein